MNRAERIYRIHTLLKSRRVLTMAHLREELHASRTTVARDIDYMRLFMGAPVVYDRPANRYYYDPEAPAFELPGLWFNQSELYALLAAEQLLESVQPGLLGPYIGPLKARIRSLLKQSGHDPATVTSRIRLQPIAARSLDPARFGTVAGAVLNARLLELSYRGRTRDEPTQRRVHPYRLVHYRDNWYLVAWCERARDLRTFSMDRIDRARELDEAAGAADEPALDRHLGASFGIFTGEAKHWAVLRFTLERARWVADERWHPDQIGQWNGEAYELQVPYSDPRELVMDILKYGPDVEVVAPQELREAVAARIREANMRYEAS
ncbi:MAG: YafY family transcriptional regulator [Gammaproteobacteria bacterium]|nr:YafY family transcriptional regulator [Gammaproteobacteria bacterium]NIR97402.1 YafY family transcriptional regulator [Gammaproteobacteria bacterium]NIT63055.1 YafY family transcriptional regulator [Gammaproteobacteria bacterium]NIV20017.1 WYL domain-containing protein [Gammaproteobacteria bacterium]NIX10093.1 WYL domain-containing protein [Gammaproteobacteria bacterium]